MDPPVADVALIVGNAEDIELLIHLPWGRIPVRVKSAIADWSLGCRQCPPSFDILPKAKLRLNFSLFLLWPAPDQHLVAQWNQMRKNGPLRGRRHCPFLELIEYRCSCRM
jgi:hypothetical protein